MPIFDNIGGIQHKVNKSFSNVNGIWVPDKKVYDNVGGIWKQAHTSAIEWTHQVIYFRVTDETFINDEKLYMSEGEHSRSMHIVDCTPKGNGGYVLYYFPTPLNLPAGSTLQYSFTGISGGGIVNCWLGINDSEIISQRQACSNEGPSDTLTYPNGVIINNIRIQLYGTGYKKEKQYNQAAADIIITPSGGKPFKLTFLDYAEQ